MKVFATRKVPEITREILNENGIKLVEWENEYAMGKEDLIQILPQYNGILVMSVEIDKEILNEMKGKVEALSLLSVGYDNVDIKTATQLGIPVSNTPDVLSESTADTAFLLMQMVARKAIFNYNRILRDDWTVGFNEHLGQSLVGKTLGILGLGRIGYVMAERSSSAFGMNILYHNRNKNIEAEKKLGANWVSFEELLEKSDVISIHSALTPETEKLFDSEAFRKMKNSAILVNTSRGKVVDELALIGALNSHEIWGAGLDVTDPEPMLPENPLLKMENVAVLPHIGSGTRETRTAMGRLAAENMVLALNGEKMKTPINPEVYLSK